MGGLVALALLGSAALSFAQHAQPAPAGDTKNLLAGKKPIHSTNHRRLGALTDGRKGREGDHWKGHLTTPFSGRDAVVDYDLGAEVTITAAWLQGDNNDSYELEISRDGKAFTPLWTAPPVRNPGLRTRSSNTLNGRGRYVRLYPKNGDGFFGITELQVFSAAPVPFPPATPEFRTASLDQQLRDATTLFGLAFAIPLLLIHRRSRPIWIAGALALAALGLYNFASAFIHAKPVDPREVALIRGVVGAIAALAVAREVFAPRRFPAHRPVVLGTLGLTGVLGVLCFYNMGQPQFYSRGHDEWTFSHYLDLRQYYTTAKYFKEIGYRGTYEADMAAYLEDHPERVAATRNIPMRDLHSLDMSTPEKQQARIDAIKQRFTPERWQELKEDLRWFRDAMGDSHWLEMLVDFGGNATPVWISIAHFLFTWVSPSNSGFTVLAFLDLALLSGMFFAVWRCYGPRTALVVMTVFGANDFIMYGTNWGGATLRHDWLAYIGYAACAFRRERFMLGGALLGLSTMIRVFPALAIAGAMLPALLRLSEQIGEQRKFPPLRELIKKELPTVRMLIGVAIVVTVAFLGTFLVLSPAAWPDCLKKISQLSADPHPASIALRSLIAGSDGNQGSVLRARQPLFIAASLLYVGLVALAARKRRMDQAAVLGMILVPVLLYPANYYIHFVFLLPLVVTEARGKDAPGVPVSRLEAGAWLTLLVMCAVQYFTVLVPDLQLHFYLETAVLFAMLTVLLAILVRDEIVEWANRPEPEPAAPSP